MNHPPSVPGESAEAPKGVEAGEDFQCLRCGACCQWEGEVRLLRDEPDAIADYLHLPVLEFIDRYTKLSRDRTCLTLTDADSGGCIFYADDQGCRIQNVKPCQCRDFPQHWRCDGWKRQCAGYQAIVTRISPKKA